MVADIVARIRERFPLFSNGEHPKMDLLAIIIQCIEELDHQQRKAALGYLNVRFPP